MLGEEGVCVRGIMEVEEARFCSIDSRRDISVLVVGRGEAAGRKVEGWSSAMVGVDVSGLWWEFLS